MSTYEQILQAFLDGKMSAQVAAWNINQIPNRTTSLLPEDIAGLAQDFLRQQPAAIPTPTPTPGAWDDPGLQATGFADRAYTGPDDPRRIVNVGTETGMGQGWQQPAPSPDQAPAVQTGGAFDQPFTTFYGGPRDVVPLVDRETALGEQARYPGQVFQRFLEETPGFSTAVPWLQSALRSRGGDIIARGHLAQVADPTLRMGQFFGQQSPTSDFLRQQLRFASAAMKKDPTAIGFSEDESPGLTREELMARGTFGDPEEGYERQFMSSIQPYLMDIAPNLRSTFYNAARNLQKRQFALNPQKSFFDVAQGAGFWE